MQISSEDRRTGILPSGASTSESAKDPISKALVAQHKYSIIECSDANGYTPLSEASAGGNIECIRTLLRLGADINRRGQFGRTPLYRAAFASHITACQVSSICAPRFWIYFLLSSLIMNYSQTPFSDRLFIIEKLDCPVAPP